jgi:trehalose utilization protein
LFLWVCSVMALIVLHVGRQRRMKKAPIKGLLRQIKWRLHKEQEAVHRGEDTQ